MPLLSIENLPFDPFILPLLIAKKRGRLKEKQIRKGALKRRQRKCTNCLQLGYNKRRCVAQPAQNGRAERARDWDKDILSSSESNSELERELAPFVEQARARAKAKAKANAQPPPVRGSLVPALPALPASPALPALPASPASPASPALQLRPKRARKLPKRFR
jgi:hypothetical protein